MPLHITQSFATPFRVIHRPANNVADLHDAFYSLSATWRSNHAARLSGRNTIEPSESGLSFAFCDLARTGLAPTQRTGSTFRPFAAISSYSLDRVKISPCSHTQRRAV